MTLVPIGEELTCADTEGDSCPNVSGSRFGIVLALTAVVSVSSVVASRGHRNDIAVVLGTFIAHRSLME